MAARMMGSRIRIPQGAERLLFGGRIRDGFHLRRVGTQGEGQGIGSHAGGSTVSHQGLRKKVGGAILGRHSDDILAARGVRCPPPQIRRRGPLAQHHGLARFQGQADVLFRLPRKPLPFPFLGCAIALKVADR